MGNEGMKTTRLPEKKKKENRKKSFFKRQKGQPLRACVYGFWVLFTKLELGHRSIQEVKLGSKVECRRLEPSRGEPSQGEPSRGAKSANRCPSPHRVSGERAVAPENFS